MLFAVTNGNEDNETPVDRIDQVSETNCPLNEEIKARDFSQAFAGLTPDELKWLDDGSFGLRISKNAKPNKRGLFQSSPSPIKAVSSPEQVQPIIYTSPADFKKEPSVHNSFRAIETSTLATSTAKIEDATFATGHEAPGSFAHSFFGQSSDTFEPVAVGPAPPVDGEQFDKKPWLPYLAERDEHQAGQRAEVKSTEQQSFFSLPPYGVEQSHQSGNQDSTPTPSSIASFHSPPTPGLSFSYLVLGSTEAPREFLPKQESYSSQNSLSQAKKLPPLPIIPLAFREPKNLNTQKVKESPRTPKPIVLNLKGETWGPPFKVPEPSGRFPKVDQQFKSAGTPGSFSNLAASDDDNLGFYVPPTAFRASNALASFSSDPIKPSFTLKTYPVNQVFSEPSDFKPYTKTQEALWLDGRGSSQPGTEFQEDVLSFIRSHSNFNAALSLKSLKGSQKPASVTPSYPSPPSYTNPPSYSNPASYPSPPASPASYPSPPASPVSYPVSTSPPSYPSSNPPSSYLVSPESPTTYRPPTSTSYVARPASTTNPSSLYEAPPKAPDSSYGAPPKAPAPSYGPPPSYSPPAKPTEQFTSSDAAPAYQKQVDANKQQLKASPPSLPNPYAPPPPPPVISVTVSTSTPQTVVGAQGPAANPASYATPVNPNPSAAPPAPSAPQLPRPVAPAPPPRPVTQTVQPFQPAANVPPPARPASTSPVQYNPAIKPSPLVPTVRPPVPSNVMTPPKNIISYPNVPQRALPVPTSTVASQSPIGTVKPVQVYLTYG